MKNGQQSGRRAGTRRILAGMNLALLGAVGVLVVGVVGVGADAQPTAARRVGGQYSCVGGQTIAGYTSVIYVLDSVNRELVGLQWNESTKQFDGVGYRDLVRDISKENDR